MSMRTALAIYGVDSGSNYGDDSNKGDSRFQPESHEWLSALLLTSSLGF